MKNWWFISFLILIAGCNQEVKESDILKHVDPFIGTGGHGHTYPGAAFPFGMVQLSPDTRKDNWDACSGYHYSDSVILGFSHTHLSGTGVGDYGDIRVMPGMGDVRIRPGNPDDPGSGYSSSFSHKNEIASPGYYSVFLQDPEILAELTVSPRCGYHQYKFQNPDSCFILIDLKESVVTEQIISSSIKFISNLEISGHRRTSGWAKDQVVYFYAVFSRPFDSFGIASDGIILDKSTEAEGKDIQGFVRYLTSGNETIGVRIGISAVSEEGARNNLLAEIPEWDFLLTKTKAEAAWQQKLSKIEITDGSPDNLEKFYTSLYHCYLAPNLFSDADGRYRGHDGNIHQAEGFSVYTVFSLWDTYRALHPLMTILEPEITNEFIQTFLDIYEKGGLLPVWELAGNETNCMIGYHAVPVIYDAYQKGIRGFDAARALEAMIKSAEADQFGLPYYREYGYIPAELEGEAISKTLEYAYDDWCIAMMAKQLNKEEEYRQFIQRAQYYKNLYDRETGFLRGKRNSMFAEPFDPTEVNFMLTEANTWQYTFYVPQDIQGHTDLMGGDTYYATKLEEMFSTSATLSGREQADITGLIGQYAHGNEPSHHMAYLFNYSGKPGRTQKLTRDIMNTLYGIGPDGLCGNEDCGQMSAWFVMSAMGIYPVTPGIGYYAMSSPLFKEIRIQLDGGEEFVIKANGNENQNIYIQSARLNGQNYNNSYINHADLVAGGTLELKMGSNDAASWATAIENRPSSIINEFLLTPVPYFKANSGSFQDELTVSIMHPDPGVSLYCQEGDLPDEPGFSPYDSPITIKGTTTIRAYALSEEKGKSSLVQGTFHKIHHGYKVSIKYPYSNQYTGGGEMALVDGQTGGPNFRTGSWQGYHGVDFEAIIDLGENMDVSAIAATFLQDQKSWIFMPVKVEFGISDNKEHFRTIAIIENDIQDDLEEPVIKDFLKKGLAIKGRYLQIKAYNRGLCPEWHVGAGEKAWLFIDEVTIE